MNTKIKSAILLLLTLLIGVIGGMLGSRLYMEHRLKSFRAMRGERFLQHNMERLLMPTPEQRTALDSILRKYQPQFKQLNRKFRSESRALLDSLYKEMAPLLTEEQKKRMQARRRMHPFDRPFGRPGDAMFGKPPRNRPKGDRPMPPDEPPLP